MSDREQLDEALRQLETQALGFGARFTNDARVRQQYFHVIRAYSQQLREAVKRGDLTAREAAQAANETRNRLMDIARLRTSDIGRAGVEKMKPQGLGLTALLEKYAKELFNKEFANLTEVERNRVFLEIVESSGRSRPSVNVRAQGLNRLGKGLLVISAGIAIYNITTAEDKVEAAKREALVAGGGFLGGVAGGAAAGLLFGPGAVIAVPVGAFLGGIAGAFGGEFLYTWSSG